ncbi:MAG: N-acetylneuraminate synthase [Candidatus Omnitrophota bacterium]|nr:N-acetylneuraminate synthase [Candidatus Omnitrophota bacterium]
MSKKVFIIAEAGVNHNGSLVIATRLVDAAEKSGVDAIKFQTFRVENIATINSPKAAYQKKTSRDMQSQFEMLKKLQLNINAHRKLIDYCKKKKIMFLSSAFDLESIDLLRHLGQQLFKIPSGEITNLPLLRKIGGLKKKIILSTGMATLDEIKNTLAVLIKAGTKKEDITVLHCNTEYPTSMEDVNLRAMLSMRDIFKVNVGYSDHTLGIEVPIAAVALGASVIEKHFTLKRNMKGPDHKASLEPKELKQMVNSIRNIEKALGNRIKRPSKSEIKNRDIVRKSIVAAKSIKKGERFDEINITVKRPARGISPMKWDEVIGLRARKDFKEDELIKI